MGTSLRSSRLDLGTLGGSWDWWGGVGHGKNLPGMLLEAYRTPLGRSEGRHIFQTPTGTCQVLNLCITKA